MNRKRNRITGLLGGQQVTAEVKSFPARIKAVDAEAGTFVAVVSVFGNVDFGGDRVMKGAFAPALAKRGLPPIYWNHNWMAGPIGYATEATETEEGLEIAGKMFKGYDLPDRVHAALLAAQETASKADFSFAYDVAPDGFEIVKEDGQQIRNITAFSDLYEASPVVVGMNEDAHLVEAASRGRKGDVEPVPGSFEAVQEDLIEELQEVEGGGWRIYLLATFTDSVIYQLYKLNPDGYIDWNVDPEIYQRDYTRDESTDAVTFGDRVAVDIVMTIVADTDDDEKSRPGRRMLLKHASAPTYIQKAHDALTKAGAKCATSDDGKAASRDGGATIDRDRQVRVLTRRRDEEDVRHEQAG